MSVGISVGDADGSRRAVGPSMGRTATGSSELIGERVVGSGVACGVPTSYVPTRPLASVVPSAHSESSTSHSPGAAGPHERNSGRGSSVPVSVAGARSFFFLAAIHSPPTANAPAPGRSGGGEHSDMSRPELPRAAVLGSLGPHPRRSPSAGTEG